jgi:hypothetical protein
VSRMVPSESGYRLVSPATAPTLRSTASPPSTSVEPPAPTCVVLNTTLPARLIASIRALSSPGSVGSVNCTSTAITFAPARCSWSITRASYRRGNGHCERIPLRANSAIVASSIPTTASPRVSCTDLKPRVDRGLLQTPQQMRAVRDQGETG